MIVSEEEAKTKRCCGPSNCGETRGRDNVPEYGDWLRYCIGSQCMAWRWMWPNIAAEAPNAIEAYRPENRQGYCGLAGRLGAKVS